MSRKKGKQVPLRSHPWATIIAGAFPNSPGAIRLRQQMHRLRYNETGRRSLWMVMDFDSTVM